MQLNWRGVIELYWDHSWGKEEHRVVIRVKWKGALGAHLRTWGSSLSFRSMAMITGGLFLSKLVILSLSVSLCLSLSLSLSMHAYILTKVSVRFHLRFSPPCTYYQDNFETWLLHSDSDMSIFLHAIDITVQLLHFLFK
jgi:hypothetical protein